MDQEARRQWLTVENQILKGRKKLINAFFTRLEQDLAAGLPPPEPLCLGDAEIDSKIVQATLLLIDVRRSSAKRGFNLKEP